MADNLKYSIELDTSKFTGGAQRATGALTGIKTAIASGIGAASGMGIVTGATAAIGKAADMARGQLDNLFGFFRESAMAAGGIERISARFQSLTGSMRDGKDIAEQLNQFAQTPPFGLEGAEAAAKALLATGTPAKDLTGQMTVLGNVAAAAGQPIEQIAEKFSEAATEGFLTMESVKMLGRGGIPVMETLAKVIGKTTDATRQALSEQKISFANYKALLNELGGTGGKFDRAMDKVGDTLTGKIETLKGRWEGLQVVIGQGFGDALKPFLDDSISIVQRVTGMAKAGIEIIKGAYAAGKLGDLVLTSLQYAFAEGANYAAGAVKMVAQMLTGTLTVAGNFWQQLTGEGELGKSFSTTISLSGDLLVDAVNMAGIKWSQYLYRTGPIVGGALMHALDSAMIKLSGALYDTLKPMEKFIPGLYPVLTGHLRNASKKDPMSAEAYEVALSKVTGTDTTLASLDKEATRTQRRMAQTVEEMKAPVAHILQTALTELPSEMGKAISKVKFEKADIFDSEVFGEKMRKLAEETNPEAVRKFMEALRGASQQTQDTAKLTGASNKALAVSANQAALMAQKMARAMMNASIMAAKAAGNYKESARLEYLQKYQDKVKEYKDRGASDEQSRVLANKDTMLEARMEKRLERPGEQERKDRDYRRTRDKYARGGVETLTGDMPQYKRTWGSLIPRNRRLIPDRGPIIPNRKAPIDSLRTAEAAARGDRSNNVKETVSEICKELIGIRGDLKKINVIN